MELKKYHFHIATISIFLILNPLGIYLSDPEYWIFYIFIPAIWLGLCQIQKDNPHSLKFHSISFILFSIFSTAYIQVIERSTNVATLFFLIPYFTILSLASISTAHKSKSMTKRIVFGIWITIILASYLLNMIHIINGPITRETIFAVLQTNSREALVFLSHILSEPLAYAISIITFYLIIIVRYIFNTNHENHKSSYSTTLTIVSILFIVLQPNSKAYAGIISIEKSINEYFKEISDLKEIVKKRKNSLQYNVTNLKEKTGEINVLVIGESLSSYHMSAYGYARNTTPWINNSATVIFKNARSSHTHTMATLSKALTSSNQYNKKDYYESESIISVAKNAGFKTAWISNQVSVGAWDNLVSVIAKESHYYKFINKSIGKTSATKDLDENLATHLTDYLETIDPNDNHFIVIHMMGSHWNYCDRTRGADINLPTAPYYFYLNKQNTCYDKSVKYTDQVLEEIHKTLITKPQFKSLLFTSDHADDVFGNKKHNSAFFTEHMTEIPLIFWAGGIFEADRLLNMHNNKKLYFTNDLLFDTMIGILGLDSEAYVASNDISSRLYTDLINNGTVLNGKRKISKLESIVSKENAQKHKKLMAHRVNTIGALVDAKKQSFNAIEFDVMYDENNDEIVVGHGKKTLTGQKLSEYLTHENHQFNRIWIDFKNLNEENIVVITEKLEVLDKQFDIKSRSLLESGITSHLFSDLSKRGWQTSYYLPTQKILTLIKNNDIGQLNQEAFSLKKQIQSQSVHSVSFDSRLYSFVDSYLYPILENKVRLNTWINLSSASPHFNKRFSQLKISKDDRIDSIIVRHSTRFKI